MSRNARLGLFVLAALLVLAVGVFWIGDEQSRFTRHYRIYSNFKSVQGLIEGAEVRVGGIHKGVVRKIALPKTASGLVSVQLDLEKDSATVIKKDSVVLIHTDGLLGDKIVEIGFGTGEDVKDGDTLTSREPADMAEMVQQAQKVLVTMQGAMENIRGATDHIEGIATKVNQGAGTLGALVNDKSVFNQAKAGVTALREDAEALKHNFLLRGFFKDRGYLDEADLGKNEIASLPAIPPSSRFTYASKQLFDADSAKLKNDKSLREAGQNLESGAFREVVVSSATGAVGDSDERHALARARAYVVRKHLAANFKVDDKRIKTIGLGKTASGQDAVEILIYR